MKVITDLEHAILNVISENEKILDEQNISNIVDVLNANYKKKKIEKAIFKLISIHAITAAYLTVDTVHYYLLTDIGHALIKIKQEYTKIEKTKQNLPLKTNVTNDKNSNGQSLELTIDDIYWFFHYHGNLHLKIESFGENGEEAKNNAKDIIKILRRKLKNIDWDSIE